MGELEESFLGSWSLLECLEMNFENDTEHMLGFFRGSPEFYPNFDRLLRERAIERFPPQPLEDEGRPGWRRLTSTLSPDGNTLATAPCQVRRAGAPFLGPRVGGKYHHVASTSKPNPV